ncbi:MAG: NAD(+) synthetase, partial [Candidatus Thermoplasmatota archaeon]
MLNINEEEVLSIIRNFIRDYKENSGREKIVIGLSGGVDSSIVAKLAVMAIGNENVHA